MKEKSLPALLKRVMLLGNLRAFYLPVLFLLILLTLTVFSLKTGISKISELQSAVGSQREIENVLKEKEELLKSVDADISEQASLVNLVLPEKNPVLFAMYQIKALGVDRQISLSNIKVSLLVTEGSGLHKIEIKFDLEGNMEEIINYIGALKSVAPLIIVDKVDFQIKELTASASVSIKSFWSPFPEKIPSLTQPISDITAEEKDILSSLFSLKTPPFYELIPQELTERPDPFE